MTRFVVREAVPGDAPDIRRVAERSWSAAYGEIVDRKTIDAAIAEWYDLESTRSAIGREDVAYYVATRDGTVIGYVSGHGADDRTATLSAIYVAPDRWGEGIGSELLGTFEAWCRRQGYDAVQFRVLADNDVGTSFYEGHGYRPDDTVEAELFGESVEETRFRGSPDES